MRRLLAVALIAWTGIATAAESIFLVSRKDMPDANFRDTVVLLTSVEGKPFGLVVNRPMRVALSSLLPELKKNEHPADRLHFGGPVAPELLTFAFMAKKRPADATEVAEGVYLAAERKLLESILSGETPVEAVRVFAGYAGWAPGQLEGEVARGDWRVTHVDAKAIFSGNPEKLWPELDRRASRTSVRFNPLQGHGVSRSPAPSTRPSL